METITEEIERLEFCIIELTREKKTYKSGDYFYSQLSMRINKVNDIIKELNKIVIMYKNL